MPSLSVLLQKLLLSLTFALFANTASAMFIQPDWLDPTEPGVGTNRYAYSGNDPINGMDPGGNAVVTVNGTTEQEGSGWSDDDETRDERRETFPGHEIYDVGNYGMANEKSARTSAAKKLARVLKGLPADEEIIVISYSHGGNVVKEYTNMEGARHIDTHLSLGTPVRSDYKAKPGGVGEHVQVYSKKDNVAPHGGVDGSKIGAWWSSQVNGTSGTRTDPQANRNIEASRVVANSGMYGPWVDPVRHTTGYSDPLGVRGRVAIHSPIVWRQHIEPAFDN